MNDLISGRSKTYSLVGGRSVCTNNDTRKARICDICDKAFVIGDYGDTRRICPSCKERLKKLLKASKEKE